MFHLIQQQQTDEKPHKDITTATMGSAVTTGTTYDNYVASYVPLFVGPIPGTVTVYNQAQNNKLVFNSKASPAPAYPTADQEENILVDTTLEVRQKEVRREVRREVKWVNMNANT